MTKLSISIVLVLLAILAAAPAYAQTPITNCRTFSSADNGTTFSVSSNLTGTNSLNYSQGCLDLSGASNITINCSPGVVISGYGPKNGVAVSLNNSPNVTINYCKFDSTSRPAQFQSLTVNGGSNYFTYDGVTSPNITNYGGFDVGESSYAIIKNANWYQASAGVRGADYALVDNVIVASSSTTNGSCTLCIAGHTNGTYIESATIQNSSFNGGWDFVYQSNPLNNVGVDDVVTIQHSNNLKLKNNLFFGAWENVIETVTKSTNGEISYNVLFGAHLGFFGGWYDFGLTGFTLKGNRLCLGTDYNTVDGACLINTTKSDWASTAEFLNMNGSPIGADTPPFLYGGNVYRGNSIYTDTAAIAGSGGSKSANGTYVIDLTNYLTNGGLTVTANTDYSSNTITNTMPSNGGIIKPSSGTSNMWSATTTTYTNFCDGSMLQQSICGKLPLQFIPITPCRVLDTRQANSNYGGPVLSYGVNRTVPIISNASSQCSVTIPSNVGAYAINFTSIPVSGTGEVDMYAWETGISFPAASLVNYDHVSSGTAPIIANSHIVGAGTSGSVDVEPTNANTNLVMDVTGYFVPKSTNTSGFFPIAPCRLYDSRVSPNTYLPATNTRTITMGGNCGLSSTVADIKAYSINVTVVPKNSWGLGFLTVWPHGPSRPNASTINDSQNAIIANAAIIGQGTSTAQLDVYASDDTDFIIDVNGYFGPADGTGMSYFPITPTLVYDTGGTTDYGSGETRTITPTSTVPASSETARVANLVSLVLPNPTYGECFITLWPSDQSQPGVSTLNALSPMQYGLLNSALVPLSMTLPASYNTYTCYPTRMWVAQRGFLGW